MCSRSFILIFIYIVGLHQLPKKVIAQNTENKMSDKQIRKECWGSENKITLLDTIKSAMKKQTVQTFHIKPIVLILPPFLDLKVSFFYQDYSRVEVAAITLFDCSFPVNLLFFPTCF